MVGAVDFVDVLDHPGDRGVGVMVPVGGQPQDGHVAPVEGGAPFDAAGDQEFVVVVGETDTAEGTQPSVAAPAEEEVIRVPAARVTTQVRPRETTTVVRPAEQPAAPKPATRTIKGTEYWIQAGSYTSQTRAEQVKENLQAKGIKSRIVSREVNGENFFRVRIGPYENAQEAEKFLAWIKEIKDFEGSYISQVYVEKTVQN